LIFVANPLEVKGEDALGIGHRDACAGGTLSLGGHLLHTLEIVQAPLQVGQALLEDLLPLRRIEKLEERHPRKNLGLIGGLFGRKIAQRGVQQRDATRRCLSSLRTETGELLMARPLPVLNVRSISQPASTRKGVVRLDRTGDNPVDGH
jgi:hypothetical protein